MIFLARRMSICWEFARRLSNFEKCMDGRTRPDRNIIEDLFQHFHSFKGISAIVGLAPAEAVAHATEDFLRLMRSGDADLAVKGLELLVNWPRHRNWKNRGRVSHGVAAAWISVLAG